MQEEMSAIQPKLVEASKEVDSSMAYVDKEQTEVSDLEKVVKGKFNDDVIYDLHQGLLFHFVQHSSKVYSH